MGTRGHRFLALSALLSGVIVRNLREVLPRLTVNRAYRVPSVGILRRATPLLGSDQRAQEQGRETASHPQRDGLRARVMRKSRRSSEG
jgi:hypothetical protein